MIEHLDENAARKLFKEQKFGHLGCVLASGEPYVVPVNYLYVDDEIYIHSLPGSKIDALRLNGKICLEDQMTVTTTTEHQAKQLGRSLKKAYDGDVRYDFSLIIFEQRTATKFSGNE
jgi:Pyridoxamine 5'-phosphate oxidase